MAIARIFSRGAEALANAPDQVIKQLENPETAEQGAKYLEGKAPRQEIDAIVAQSVATGAERQRDEIITAVYGESGAAIAKAENTPAKRTAEAFGEAGKGDPYTKSALTGPEGNLDQYIDVAPSYVDKSSYIEIGYDLPDKLTMPYARGQLSNAGHWMSAPQFHVRREQTTDSLRVFEVQSDLQNTSTKELAKDLLDVLARDIVHAPETVDLAVPSSTIDDAREISLGYTDIADLSADRQEAVNKVFAYIEPNLKQARRISPYKLAWQKDIINRQFTDAANSNKSYVDFLIAPSAMTAKRLKRSEVVQATYEGQLTDTIKKQAKKISADTEVIAVFGDSYLRVKLPTVAGGTGLAAFSIPAFALEEQIQDAIDAGYTPVEIKAELKSKGEDPDIAMRMYYGPKAKDAIANGYSPREVLRHMQSLGIIPEAPYNDPDQIINDFIGENTEEEIGSDTDQMMGSDDISEALRQTSPQAGSPGSIESLVQMPPQASISVDMSPEEQYSSLVNMQTKYSTMGKAVLGWAGNDRLKQEAALDIKAMDSIIVQSLKQRGIEAELLHDGTMVYYDEQGKQQELDQGFLEGLLESKREIGGALTGAAIGARGFAAGPVVGAITTVASSAVGAAFGRGSDVLVNAMELKEELESQFVIDRMVDAGVADATMGIAFGVALQSIKGSYYGTKATIKIVGNAFDAFIRGNKNGAYDALKSISNMSEQQISDMMAEWSRISGAKLDGSTKDQAIQVYAETQPGGQDLVNAAIPSSKTVGSKLAAQISDRANTLRDSVQTITNDNIGVVLTDDLAKYIQATKDGYTGIKSIGVETMKDANYRFNYDELMIEPILAQAEKAITNPALLQRFSLYAEKIRQFGQATALGIAKEAADQGKRLKIEDANPLRSFDNLLELRRTVNEFRYNMRFKSIVDREAVDTAMKGIDTEINNAAREYMPDGSAWLKEWRKVNTEYAKMKGLERNVLYRALTRPGIDPNKVISSLANRVNAIDGTFMEVLGTLPPRTRINAEGAVLDHFIGKHSVGFEGGKHAVNFPLLAKELEHVTLTTSKARDLKRVITDMAGVYKNDVHLSIATGRIPLPKFQSYLTADPVIRLKFEFMSTVFNRVKQHTPSDKAKQIALVMKVAKALDKPANVRNTDELLKLLPEDVELRTALKRLTIEYAKTGERQNYPKVNLYRVAKPGRQFTTGKTELGPGRALYTDEKAAKKAAKDGSKVYTEEVLPKRIAATDDLAILLGRQAAPEDLNNLRLITQLKDKGFLGVTIGDKVTVFK